MSEEGISGTMEAKNQRAAALARVQMRQAAEILQDEGMSMAADVVVRLAQVIATNFHAEVARTRPRGE